MPALSSGPDEPGIYCYPPDGCCGPDVCNVTEDEFVCAIRALLPEGEPWNNTRKYIRAYQPLEAAMVGCTPINCSPPGGQLIDGGAPPNQGTTTVGCALVGCEQLVFGGCCDDEIPCEDDPLAPQLAVVDSFAAVAYSVLLALCEMLRELDPCTARSTVHRWAERFGITHPDPCGAGWSDQALKLLICLYMRLRYRVWNKAELQQLAAAFGACIDFHWAGDICTPGLWTLAGRGEPACPPAQICPPGPIARTERFMRMVSTCYQPPPTMNIVLCPCEIVIPPNCNLKPVVSPRPHNPELYEVFKWLLPQLLPRNVVWCVYDCCIQ